MNNILDLYGFLLRKSYPYRIINCNNFVIKVQNTSNPAVFYSIFLKPHIKYLPFDATETPKEVRLNIIKLIYSEALKGNPIKITQTYDNLYYIQVNGANYLLCTGE